MNGSRKQSIVYAVRDYQPLKESSVACSATMTDGARSLTMRRGLITDVSFSEDRIMSSCVTPLVRKESSPVVLFTDLIEQSESLKSHKYHTGSDCEVLAHLVSTISCFRR
ncbi:hypothetical protein YC2023_037138 [Brassica napus]